MSSRFLEKGRKKRRLEYMWTGSKPWSWFVNLPVTLGKFQQEGASSYQNYLMQFNWPRAIWKRDLYFDKSNENYFLRANFLNELFYLYLRRKYALVEIISNEYHFCRFYRCLNAGELVLLLLILFSLWAIHRRWHIDKNHKNAIHSYNNSLDRYGINSCIYVWIPTSDEHASPTVDSHYLKLKRTRIFSFSQQ